MNEIKVFPIGKFVAENDEFKIDDAQKQLTYFPQVFCLIGRALGGVSMRKINTTITSSRFRQASWRL